MKSIHVGLVVLSLSCFACSVQAKTIESSKMTPQDWASLMEGHEGESDIVVFHEGDSIPVRLQASGDLLVSAPNQVMTVRVATEFFVRRIGEDVQLSWDGTEFKPLKEMVTGNLSASASAPSAGDPVTGMVLKADLFKR